MIDHNIHSHDTPTIVIISAAVGLTALAAKQRRKYAARLLTTFFEPSTSWRDACARLFGRREARAALDGIDASWWATYRLEGVQCAWIQVATQPVCMLDASGTVFGVAGDKHGTCPFIVMDEHDQPLELVLVGELVRETGSRRVVFLVNDCFDGTSRDYQSRLTTARSLIDGTPDTPSMVRRQTLDAPSRPSVVIDAIQFKLHVSGEYASMLMSVRPPREFINLPILGTEARLSTHRDGVPHVVFTSARHEAIA